MNKNAIKNYAIWARNELIDQVKQRAYQYGITVEGYGEENASVIAGRVLTSDEKRQRSDIVIQIKKNGFQQAVEEVAYTWFNRFVALRFMEVNDYLPTHVRVFSDASGSFNPEILKDVLHLDLKGLDKTKVSELLNANQTEELYRYLLLTQCNALNEILPEMFEKLGSHTEMLLPNNLLKQDGIIGRLVTDIDEDDWKDAVQIIGWMYQYYNTEPKQEVFDGLKKNIKITKENIPAATQLFTPDWIVRYMVENSLGRIWLESHPNDALKANWKYYLDEAEQTPEVAEQLRILRSQSPVKSPEDIRLIDPCMGSGHILVYAFDVLMQIYESEGYNPRDVTKLILEKNIYGLDIDRRAYQLAYFSLMMKARQYNRRVFSENIEPQVYHPEGFPDGEEYGSLVKVDKLPPKPVQFLSYGETYNPEYETQLRVWNFKRLLAQKYDVVVTNPPYAGGRNINALLSKYLNNEFSDSKSDMYAAFIERGLAMLKPSGFSCMVTMQSWMFLSSFEVMRARILSSQTLTNLMHMENMVMGIAFGTAVSNIRGFYIKGYKCRYNHITMADIEDDKPNKFPPKSKRNSVVNSEVFSNIPGTPIAYWVKNKNLFVSGSLLENIANPRQGLKTLDNDYFVRSWFEVSFLNIGLNIASLEAAAQSGKRWFPLNHGGEFRKYYGNNNEVVNWYNDGQEMKALALKKYNSITRTITNIPYYFKEGITWTVISSSSTSFRRYYRGFIFSNSGQSIVPNEVENLDYLTGFLNTKIVEYMLSILSPGMGFESGYLKKIPIIFDTTERVRIEELANENIALSRVDWDSFETSWDFKQHPLVESRLAGAYAWGDNEPVNRISSAYKAWEILTEGCFQTQKSNEEELNRIFIDIYGLQEELTPEVEDKVITVHRIFDSKDDIPESMKGSKYALTKTDVIKSFISYSVGCIFGRYSLDVEGLAYAGGEWDNSKYKSFISVKDNILPICDDDYFDDDILGLFVDFVRVVYGADTVEENLAFIADALGGKGTPREVIRNYFLKDFYKDHCKTYQKRPIYWLFDSGKRNGFKALIYLHRYQSDLLAKLRTDYVHEQQERYHTQLSHITTALNTATGSERARLLKQQDKLSEQLKEITAFEEKVHHLADQNIEIDLDNGIKENYKIFSDVLAKI